ncbi:MAG: DUF3109 family protein [Ichthyobacteriaceae bacterium]|nr:DUF3109 family protein [Ichthyobacteriaceae bacterium]
MIQIGKALVSENIIEKQFVCDYEKCKGECCVAGDAGAPVEKNELEILDEIFDKVKPYITEKGIKSVEEFGTWTKDDYGEYVTPLIDGKECAYTVFDDKGNARCGIEDAYNAGAISWRKPISCSLYPIRLREYSEFTAVNYDKWSICSDACVLGRKLKTPVFEFLKEPLTRYFGEKWYSELELVASEYLKQKK